MADDKKNRGGEDYKPSEIEPYWQKKWEEIGIYSPNLDTSTSLSAKKPFDKAQGKPFYNLMMFPYPSAEGMHVGNMYAFTGADVYGRFMRMQGNDVFEPIGLDGFGIHSENYAIKIGRHPKEQAKVSESNFYRQLRATGNGFDWSRKLETYDPKYYKWTQWLFIQLFKVGLAYRKKAAVNFCPSCKTVLADEQVIKKLKAQSSNGKTTTQNSKLVEEIAICERCETEVEKKELEQWFFRITKYANKLLANIPKLDWSEKVKIAQKQWIGKSEGAKIRFKIYDLRFKNEHVEVFTTRPDTLFGATFVVLAPEHGLVDKILNQVQNDIGEEVRKYVDQAKKKTEQERLAEGREKTGVFTGLYAINPGNKEKIPIWIADYVLMGYGTGAIMGVPAHDQRDFEFAKKYDLPIKQVIVPTKKSAFADALVSQTDLLDDRLDNLKQNITQKVGFVKGVDLPGVEPGRPGLSSRSSKPAKPTPKSAYTGFGMLVNSGKYTGLSSKVATGKMINDFESKGVIKKEISYHLRDWLISRQRYWGPPIPMIYCQVCAKKGNSGFTLTKKSSTKEDYLVNLKADSLNGWLDTLEGNISKQNKDVNSQFKKGMDSPGVEPGRFGVSSQPSKPAEPMPESVYKNDNEIVNDWNSAGWFPIEEKELPVLLPDVKDWKPKGTGKSPLATVESFVNTTCPNCKGSARRETDVSDTFLDSAWYFFRYLSTDIDSAVFDIERVKKWLPVEMYIGGVEHSVLHLLYSRFITMVLHDLGYVSFEEPFSRFFAHGLLIKEKAKMSKSKGNVVVPDEYIKKFGADTLRMYLMFLGPFSQGGDFYDTGIEGMHRFVRRVWTLLTQNQKSIQRLAQDKSQKLDEERLRMMHRTIKKVTDDISNLRYNTAIAAMMEWYNYLNLELRTKNLELTKEETETFLKLLAPFAPHVTEELYQRFKIYDLRFKNKEEKNHKSYFINHKSFQSIHLQPWPTFDPKFLEEDEVTIVVQVNGKLRDTLKSQKSIQRLAQDKSQKYIEELARESERVRKYLEGKEIKKVVYVEGKVINFVTD